MFPTLICCDVGLGLVCSLFNRGVSKLRERQLVMLFSSPVRKYRKSYCTTAIILNIGTDRSEQTVQTQIRLLLMEQSDQGLLCLLFCLHF